MDSDEDISMAASEIIPVSNGKGKAKALDAPDELDGTLPWSAILCACFPDSSPNWI